VKRRKRSPVIASLLSVITPGLGQAYNRQIKKCIFFYTASLLLPALLSPLGLQYDFNGIIILFALLTLFYLLIIVDAFISAARLKTIEIKPYSRINVYFLIIFFVIFYLYASVFVMENIVGIKTYRIPSHSMSPTIIKGDHIIADLKYYKTNKPARGDIVIFRFPEDKSKFFMKRIVAIGGDTIQGIDKTILLNGTVIREPYIQHIDPEVAHDNLKDNFGPLRVPEETFFVMGDNRDESYDSRQWGTVEKRDIIGKALYVYWSTDRDRIGMRIR
jgi:signal peptidase I